MLVSSSQTIGGVLYIGKEESYTITIQCIVGKVISLTLYNFLPWKNITRTLWFKVRVHRPVIFFSPWHLDIDSCISIWTVLLLWWRTTWEVVFTISGNQYTSIFSSWINWLFPLVECGNIHVS